MKVQNKVIVVTGGGSGIGRELVLNLLSRGARVVAVDLNETTLEETATLAGNNKHALTTYVADLTNRASVEAFAEKTIARLGVVDGIINNAGIIQPFIKVAELDFELIERVINVNFYGTLYMVKAFLPHLLTRPEAHIVNISSMGGFLPVPGQTIYGASKAAVKLLTEGLHSELGNTNVKVTVVFPGAVKTNISKNSGINNPRQADGDNKTMKVLSAVKAAQIIIDGMEQDKYRVLVGKDAKFLDLFSRFNPKSAASFIADKMKQLVK